MPSFQNFKLPDLIELYSQKYSESMERWRELGARDKAQHILSLTKDDKNEIKTVLEVGCGTGVVLEELAKAGYANRLFGIEIGTERSEEHQKTVGACEISISAFDGTKIPFPDEHFDFVFATHVLEHVGHERQFLYELRRVSRRFVFLEVPCELHLRSSRYALQTTLNIGHVNAYTPESFLLTLETSGLRVKLFDVFDHSFAVHAFHTSKVKALLKMISRRFALMISKRFASRVFAYHCAALCEKGQLLAL